MRVLVVYTGNICRSPMGQGMLENELAARGVGARVTVESAGTHGFHAGKAPDELAQAEAASRGVDISAQRCREITPEDFDAFDLVLAMDRQNVNHLWGTGQAALQIR